MKTETFHKAKSTRGLFFKRISPSANVTQFEDKFEIGILSHIFYSGTYYIKSIEKQNNNETVYKVFQTTLGKADDKEFIKDDMKFDINPFYIQVTKHRNVLSIYNSNLEGIILKK